MTFVDPTSSATAAATGPAAAATSPTGSSGATAGAGTTAGEQKSGLNQLTNSQTFLQLLVAQLKNQNPDNPTDPTAFMTEIAQLTAVQSQTNLNAEEQTVAADSMIGRTVAGTGDKGKPVSGTVTAVLLSSSGPPTLQLAGTGGTNPTLALDAVTRVYASTGGSSGTTTSTSPTSTASSTPTASSTSTGSPTTTSTSTASPTTSTSTTSTSTGVASA